MSDVVLAWDEGDEESESVGPSSEEVSACVQALDGASRTLVTIYRGEAHLAVGGGASSGMVVYCTSDNEVFWQLVGDPGAQGVVVVTAGGQEGVYEARFRVRVAAATEAAVEFLATGNRSERVTWEQS
ncbi:Imm1 family immunity protein [Nocardioides sp.]|uniref:Imm1 family immunity protein n=1 Tax=Nocardioides sp. TaxID=35761 RepID=UPI0019A9041E|nr:Imm1 family immunity protein [Nocardioides sp.]MBC7274914.1 hypothetical protein [Nocardioides sp.]